MKEKRVKKLILKKEEIVNLSEYQMKSIQGGITTSAACVKSFLETVSYIAAIYSVAKGESWVNCEYSNQDCMTDISQRWIKSPDGGWACEIPEVDIYPYRL